MRNIAPLLCLIGGALLLLGGGGGSIIDDSETVDGKMYAIVVEEKSDRSPELAAIIRNDDWIDGLATRDIRWRLYDVDDAEAVANGYSAKAKETGLPAILLVDEAGEALIVERCPSTVQGIDELIARFGR